MQKQIYHNKNIVRNPTSLAAVQKCFEALYRHFVSHVDLKKKSFFLFIPFYFFT